MRVRFQILAVPVVAVLLFGLGATSPAPAKTMARVIPIAMSSYKFEPNLFFVNEGDTVVLQLENIDPQRPHAFNSPYLSKVDFTVSGQYAQGVTPDGTKYVRLEHGQKAEITFVAKGRGQYGFICSLAGAGFNHAARGQTGAFVVWPAGYHPATK
ncbi:MAG: hypothetical protein E6H04_07295 [Bacillati bacterium ANGP1]|uniref:EfeO-type cupredoxin-like domain-containing protein n=1 Tax=Candidatus Segetimicrobium genomatis TaxID=2569760 RepID=A0A537JCZ0_9BACT|nr:MAG: hypothetical protein E6H04_07295 [Terrabacteria group bacterium ANGP1]